MKMKRIIDTLIILAVSMLAFSCQEGETLDVTMNESIILDLSSGLTKAEDTSTESFVNHLDIFIFKAVASGSGYVQGEKVYYGRYSVNNASSVTLNTKRSSYSKDDRFYVYLVANTSHSQDYMSSISGFNDLQNVMQEDEYIHFTGLSVPNAPKYFLMDALAKDSSDRSPVQLNNGVLSDNTELTAELKRAAAKVVINITAGSDVRFNQFTYADGSSDPESDGRLYYVRNLPYDTYLLAGVDASTITAKRRTTMKGSSAYFSWNKETEDIKVSLTAYVYPHNWINESLLDHETCVVMNLPMIFKPGTAEETSYKNSWYKVPMSKDQRFERNRYYEVNITINRPGATSDSNPQELTDIYYAVEDWTAVEVEVGGEDRPKYLMVNKTDMEMHNVAVDASTLEFASSSPVTVTVKDVYYYNKFGQKTSFPSGDISGTTEGGITGNITVSSPVPENNAILYFTLVVTNQDGISREVNVTQYPLEYITNQQGWYSYRSDFYTGTYAPTTYEYKGSRRVAADWDDNRWNYSTSVQNNYFFGSKVSSMRENGTSALYYYYWEQYGSSVSANRGNLDALDNARMYHVQITASSGKYTIGIPKQDADGFTDDDPDNAKLVSPSFMIASQLGATQPPISVEQAERHCREYVEVHDPDNNPSTDNAVHYDNWRLPTAAEIQIIIDFQYVENAAMDEVLSGPYYWSATGAVNNPGSSDDGDQSAVRCIRDVY